MPFDLHGYLQERRRWVDEALDRFLPPVSLYPQRIHEAMRYSVFAGGKRLRGILVVAGAEAAGCEGEKALPLASSIEMIHTYSLIHDDLPAMDNADYRRGLPSCHKKFGEAIAILAGDALFALAFALISEEAFTRTVEGNELAWILREIAQAAGTGGIVGGQTMDILSQGQEIDPDLLKYIHTHKTGILIRTSLRVGAILGRPSDLQLQALSDYGEKIGLAFQIMDDILDVEGEKEKMGKELGRDKEQGKITYPGVLGLARSKAEAKRLVEEAVDVLSTFPGPNIEPLRFLAKYIIQRSS